MLFIDSALWEVSPESTCANPAGVCGDRRMVSCCQAVGCVFVCVCVSEPLSLLGLSQGGDRARKARQIFNRLTVLLSQLGICLNFKTKVIIIIMLLFILSYRGCSSKCFTIKLKKK